MAVEGGRREVEVVPEGEPKFGSEFSISIWTGRERVERLGEGAEVAGCFLLDTVRDLGALGILEVVFRGKVVGNDFGFVCFHQKWWRF